MNNKNLCDICLYPESNPCQCFSCDPDGTRYICKCDWIDEEEFILFDEEVVRNLKKIKELLNDKKTTTRFDHVRGNVEVMEIMNDSIDRAIEIIETKEG